MYLGRLLSLWDAHDTEIDHRRRRAQASFGTLKKELTDKGYSLFQRLRLFNSNCVHSVWMCQLGNDGQQGTDNPHDAKKNAENHTWERT